MALSKIKFNINNQGLEKSADEIEKIPGLIITGVTVTDGVVIGQANKIFSLKQAEQLGIKKEGVNAFAYKHLQAYFSIAGAGLPIWVMLVSDGTSMTDMVDKFNAHAKKLIEKAKEIRVLGVIKKASGAETISNAFDQDVHNAVVKAQELCDHFTSKYYPLKVIISGNRFNGNLKEMTNYETTNYKDINLLIANDDGASEAAIGLCLGRQAIIPSQRRQNRIKDGAIIPLKAYFTNGKEVDEFEDFWDAFDDRRYTFFRNFPNRSGYYFSGEKTLVGSANDFSTLAPGFVINEALLIANNILTGELSEEIPFTSEGLIHPAVTKSWQGKIESEIKILMQDTGKISGVKASINAKQKLAKKDALTIGLSIQPVGYADYITVNIGFSTKLEA